MLLFGNVNGSSNTLDSMTDPFWEKHRKIAISKPRDSPRMYSYLDSDPVAITYEEIVKAVEPVWTEKKLTKRERKAQARREWVKKNVTQ